MKLKALFVAISLSALVSVAFADDKKAGDAKPAEAKADAKKEEKVSLKDGVSAELKAAYEAAETETKAIPKGFEWFWGDKKASEQLEDGVKAANEGKDEDAMKIFKKVAAAGKAAQGQAEAAKTAGPHF
jgi:hypothetical protein